MIFRKAGGYPGLNVLNNDQSTGEGGGRRRGRCAVILVEEAPRARRAAGEGGGRQCGPCADCGVSGTGLMTFPGSGLALYHFTGTRTETRKAGKIAAAKHASHLCRFAAPPTGTQAPGLWVGPGHRRMSPEGRPGVCGPRRAGASAHGRLCRPAAGEPLSQP